MFPTLDRSRPRHDSGEEFASSYQPLSKPSLLAPPTKPRYRTHACIQLPATTSHWYLPSVTTLSVPSNRVIIILPIGRSYPVFPLCWLKAFDKELQLPFSARAASLSFLICVQIAAFPPVCGLFGWGCCFSSRRSPSCCGSRCVVSVPWYTWFATA